MKNTTLCFLIDGEKICLAMKKRGFGEGKWNGVGGKVEEGESIEEAALRELREEIKVESELHHMEKKGRLEFAFDGKPEWAQRMHIYFIEEWVGEPEETDEMRPAWYHVEELPYDEMWVDDPHWLPKVLEGKKVEGEFKFTEDGSEMLDFDIREL